MSTSTTVLWCGDADSAAEPFDPVLQDRVRLCRVSQIEDAFERVLLDANLLMVLLDARWPAFDGARLIARLRQSSVERIAELPVFVLERAGHDLTAQSWLREGADGMLSERRELHGLRQLLTRMAHLSADTIEVDLEVQSDVGGQPGWDENLPVRVRASDHWHRHSGQSGALQLRCAQGDVWAPLTRLTRELQQRPGFEAGRLRVRLRNETYHMPL